MLANARKDCSIPQLGNILKVFISGISYLLYGSAIDSEVTHDFSSPLKGVSNGPVQFESAPKIWTLLELPAKIT